MRQLIAIVASSSAASFFLGQQFKIWKNNNELPFPTAYAATAIITQQPSAILKG